MTKFKIKNFNLLYVYAICITCIVYRRYFSHCFTKNLKYLNMYNVYVTVKYDNSEIVVIF